MRRERGLSFCSAKWILLIALTCNAVQAQDNPNLIKKILAQAAYLVTLDELDRAKQVFKMALDLEPNSIEAMKGLGKIAYQKEDWPKFSRWFLRALEIDSTDQEANNYWLNQYPLHSILHTGDSLLTAGQFKEAKDAYNEARKLDKSYFKSYVGLARVAKANKNWEAFNVHLNKALKRQPDHIETHRLFESNPNYMKLLVEADVQYNARQFAAARETYRLAAVINVYSRYLRRRLGQLAFLEKDWPEVESWYHKLIELDLENDLEANYHRGLALRETAKYSVHLVKRFIMGRARKSFKKVIQLDPTYEDVLYQAAQVEKEQGRWLKMLRLAQRQVSLKPELTQANTALLYYYRIVLEQKSPAQLDSFFTEVTIGDWPDYVRGIWYRRQGVYAKADSILQGLILRDSRISHTTLYLSLVRNDLAAGRQDTAHIHFNNALNSIRTTTDAEFMFAATKYLFTDLELDFYRKLKAPEQKQDFFVRFWNARDPVPATRQNQRVVSHFSRLNYAEKLYWYDTIRMQRDNPDIVHQLSFPKIYELNEEFNDKGLVYIRHGKPDKVARTADITNSNESWMYYANGEHPKMIFHFVLEGKLGSGNNWRLTPYLSQLNIVEDRLGWDSDINRLYLALKPDNFQAGKMTVAAENRTMRAGGETAVSGILYDMVESSRQTVQLAMSSDTHQWHRSRTGLPMYYVIANRRGANDKTHMEIFTGIPIKELFTNEQGTDEEVTIEHGAGIFDQEWQKVDRMNETTSLIRSDSQFHHGFFIEKYDFYLKSGSYNLSVFAEDDAKSKLGGVSLVVKVPNFAKPGLGMSDMLVAFDVSANVDESKFRRGDVTVIPNPTRKFSRSEMVTVCFEVYGLSLDHENETRYRIKTKLSTDKQKKGFLKSLFSRNSKKSISIQNDLTGNQQIVTEFVPLDVSKLKPGTYKLTLQVTDLLSLQATKRSIEITLTE